MTHGYSRINHLKSGKSPTRAAADLGPLGTTYPLKKPLIVTGSHVPEKTTPQRPRLVVMSAVKTAQVTASNSKSSWQENYKIFYFLEALSFELKVSGLLGRHSYHLSHSVKSFFCDGFFSR
jgi:hypothetical protein